MGYDSTFEVRVEAGAPGRQWPVRLDLLAHRLHQLTGCGFETYPHDAGALHTSGKWYEAREHMRQLSAWLPADVVVSLTRYGEDVGDTERHYYRAGEEQGGKAEVRFPPNPFARKETP
ncbi:MAG TPA: hypothetical protein VG276_26490 [Actinomycetes bacterium]|jgi:hypothetical protein|nr:hypothetical protein [Actinomycetes bacterium]